ncbi:hypothetical protein KAJ83_04330 [Marivibrio halodurans]|uniref:Strictosidine synthase n=1 Tax=Marivibrio halodurans TaxID=2039722 RepID=A0A8J7S3U8_9PROT|nr:hypothetical protein [Marivibrio halodurans]MBP5856224.1 hypothetical protein [Marivibrio halodurans]
MIGPLIRGWDNLLGRGEAAVTVPALDGALRPNRALDEAAARMPLADVDDLAVLEGTPVASAGRVLHELSADGAWAPRARHDADILALAALADGGLALALEGGDILVEGGAFAGRRVALGARGRCITAMAASGATLHVAVGSTRHARADWQHDLLGHGSSGEIWRVDLATGARDRLAYGLGYPAGLVHDGGRLVFSEAWRHRLVAIDPNAPHGRTVLYHDMPGYPGRIVAAAGGGHWLSVFAPRSQLIEFVLREPAYRARMVAEVPRPYWIVPKLRAGRSFHEPLQGGGVKHLGILKPWAPTMSFGLCVKLDGDFQPRSSLHSRADGATHGVTAIAEPAAGGLLVAARGDGVVVRVGADRRGGGR